MLYDEKGIVAFPYRIECSNNLSEVEIATMFYEIQIDWNKTIILPMDKHTTAAVDAVFGTAMSVFRREYESGIGEGLTHDKDWKPVITVIRTDEFLARRNRSSEIAAKREAEKQGA